VVALDYGRKIADGPYAEVAANEQVIEAYLGRKAAEPA
jgi:branched-chain amino acid transport system ATP-binding protein